jgi:hypothetical protein
MMTSENNNHQLCKFLKHYFLYNIDNDEMKKKEFTLLRERWITVSIYAT